MTFIYANFTTIMFALNFGEKKRKKIYVRSSKVTEVEKNK